jgi:hypothetical protein
MRQQPIASAVVDPARAQVYAEGWGVVDVVPATAWPYLATSPESARRAVA